MGSSINNDPAQPVNPVVEAPTVTRQQIICEARKWLGTPYVHQASKCQAGTDCLGLVRGVYRALCGTETETPPAYERFASANKGESLWQAAQRHLRPVKGPVEPGQVLLFRLRPSEPAHHLAIYSGGIGNAITIIHACFGASVVEVSYHRWWQSRCVAQFEFPNCESYETPEHQIQSDKFVIAEPPVKALDIRVKR